MKSQRILLALSLLFSLFVAAQPKYEFRGVWIASVANIDWPKGGMTDPAAQRADFIRMLDQHQRNGMNAMIVQIRPAADAFYPSPYEPWSEWLTGEQGKAPVPYWDPLAFMIEETHKRGMEFHAWLNPYRAVQTIGKSSIAADHITKRKPEWFLVYGDKKYFDPGNKDAQQFVVKVVRDIVKRYPIDAIHMDDYFYPYRIAGKEFPDAASYARSGSRLNKEDWRRSNVDSIILAISKAIKEEKKQVRFGISPFSVWRNQDKDPRGSDSRAGQTNYDDLYADILLWLEKGWIDYVTPQLYLEIGHDKIAYEKLLDWWSKNAFGKHIYIGHGIYRVDEKTSVKWKNPTELPNQLKLLRQNSNVQGSIYFSSKSFDKNPNGWNDSLQNNYYKYPALVPPMDWVSKEKPAAPVLSRVTKKGDEISFSVKPLSTGKVPVKYFVIYRFPAGRSIASLINQPSSIFSIVVKPIGFDQALQQREEGKAYQYYITAVGTNNFESEPVPITTVEKE
ncbi:MAG: glycoside hydrolase family 10 protein [Chitinophagaceae bacterium]